MEGFKESIKVFDGIRLTESPYEMASIIRNSGKGLRVIYDPAKNWYLYNDENKYIHSSMMTYAILNGIYPGLHPREADEYMWAGNSNSPICLWFRPMDTDKPKIVGFDSYTEELVYSFGHLGARSEYSDTPIADGSVPLIKMLGKPIAYYDMNALGNKTAKTIGESASSEETDDHGRPLSQGQAAFFRDSKIRDRHGRLLTCYHSTTRDFDEFDPKKASSNGELWGRGFYFSTTDDHIYSYGDKYVEAYLNVENPWVIGASEGEIAALLRKYLGNGFDADLLSRTYATGYGDVYAVENCTSHGREYTPFREVLESCGYDGIIVGDPNDLGHSEDEIVVFRPNQIKRTSNANPSSSNGMSESCMAEKGLKEAKSLGGGVFATESPYEVKNILNSAADETKVLYDPKKRLYIYGKANDYIHNEMLEKAWEAGYYPELRKWELPEYEEEDGSEALVYLWFIPGGDSGGRTIGIDGYTEEWFYPNGVLCARSHYSEAPLYDQSFELPRVLGKPKSMYVVGDWETMEPKRLDPEEGLGESRSANESYLTEKTRQQLLDKSRNGAAYAPGNRAKGKNRYERRKYSKVAATVKDYNSIDMNAFFKGDYLEFGVPVHGETDDYVVTVTFERILPRLQQEVRSDKNRLSEKAVLRALLGAFNTGDVYVSCTCLHPDTRIKLLDGTNPTVAEMKERFDKGEKLYVYSADGKGDFKPGEVEKVWVAKTARDFVKVTLDDGQEILTTPDHPYMLRNGEYAEAKDLVPGTSLMPMYFKELNGYEQVKLNSKANCWKSVYKLVADYFKHGEIDEAEKRALATNVLDTMPYLVAIHHKDFNKKNNTPENLQIMTSKEHWDYHASLTERHKANLRLGTLRNYDEDRKQQQREIMLKVHADHPELYTHDVVSKRIREAREKNPDITKKISESHKRLWANYTEEEYKARCAINKESVHKGISKRVESFKKTWANKPEVEKEAFRKRLSEAHKGIKVVHSEECKRKMSESAKALSPEIKAKRRTALLRANIKRVLDYMLAHGIPLSDDGYSEALSEMRKQDKRYNNYPSSVEKAFNDFDDAVRHFNLNHKVAKVERITLDDTPVYDIQVKGWHNFVLDAGVMVHNCKDFQFAGFNYLAVKQDYNSNPIFGKAMQPPTIRNPHDDKGAACKHILRVLSDVSWMMNVARVIYNYIKVSRELMQRNYAEIIFPKVYGRLYKGVVQSSIMDMDDMWGDALLPSDKKELDSVIAAAKLGRDERGRFTRNNPYAFRRKPSKMPAELPPEQGRLGFGNEPGKKEGGKDNANDRG